MHDVLIICNHHRRSLFFEETMRILYEAGLENIFIQETGYESFGPYSGPFSRKIIRKNISHDAGMVNFKSWDLNKTGCKYILKIDSDFFIHDAGFILKLIEEADKGKYDFVTAIKKGCSQKEYDFSKGIVQPVLKQTFVSTKEYPYICPNPHYEGFCAIWSMNIWNKISQNDFSHGRKLYKGLYENGGKIGIYYTDYVGSHSQVFNKYIHIANLIVYYYALEKGDQKTLISNPSRLGYFYAQERKYGINIYPKEIQNTLKSLNSYKQLALDEWDKLTTGTCMQDYYR